MISVIINVHNGEKFLRSAIESVYSQTISDWEVVVVDNCSSDLTERIARNFCNKVRYFKLDSFVTLGLARQIAIEQSRGEFLAFLDSDDYWLEIKLESDYRVFSTDADTSFIYSNFYYSEEASGALRVARGLKCPSGYVFTDFIRKYPVGMLTASVRRAAVERRHARFDPRFSLVEEYDFFMQILKHERAFYNPLPLAVCRIHSKNTSHREPEKWFYEYSLLLTKMAALVDNTEDVLSLKRLRRKVDCIEATRLLITGDVEQSRSLQRQNWRLDAHGLLISILSCLPRPLYRLILINIFRGMIYRQSI